MVQLQIVCLLRPGTQERWRRLCQGLPVLDAALDVYMTLPCHTSSREDGGTGRVSSNEAANTADACPLSQGQYGKITPYIIKNITKENRRRNTCVYKEKPPW